MPWVETTSPPAPPPNTFTQQLLDSAEPWLEHDPQNALRNFLTALGAMFDPIYQLVADQGFPDDPDYVPGWSTLLDPDAAPTWALPWTGQFVGVPIPVGTDDADARALIKAEAGFQRGTAASIVSAVKRNLTGTQSVFLLERTPTPYHFIVMVRPEEVTTTAAITQAVDNVRPAGVRWTLIVTDGWTIFQMEATYVSINALEAAFTTVTGLEQDQVGH